jgi:hypothetical protein
MKKLSFEAAHSRWNRFPLEKQVAAEPIAGARRLIDFSSGPTDLLLISGGAVRLKRIR